MAQLPGGAHASQVTDATGNGHRRLSDGRVAMGAGPAAKAVAEDISTLLRAEIDLAKAEVTEPIKAKATGIGLFAGAGVLGWLGIQGLLITLALVLAIWLPLWAGAAIVTGVLLVGAAGLALVGKKKLAVPVSLEATKQNVEEDVEWTKSHLGR
jgi:hypothetical protein